MCVYAGEQARSLEVMHPTKGMRIRMVAPPPVFELSGVWVGALCEAARDEGTLIEWKSLDGEPLPGPND